MLPITIHWRWRLPFGLPNAPIFYTTTISHAGHQMNGGGSRVFSISDFSAYSMARAGSNSAE
jgi:hypothetical protein